MRLITIVYLAPVFAITSLSSATVPQKTPSASDLQQRFDAIVTQRTAFIQQHDREKRLSGLSTLHQRLKSCPAGTEITQACQALQREFSVLTMLYFRSLTQAERDQLRLFSQNIHTLYKEALQHNIQLKRQDDPFDLLFI